MRHKYLELDGLRGVAALSVALLHGGSPFFGARYQFLWHRQAFLAVDFFLLLSGFVVAYAYEERLKIPGNRRGFIIDRAIRLHPLLILGAITGALALFLREAPPTVQKALIYAFADSVPLPLNGPGWAFPANMPVWSLFWELALNLMFAFISPYLTTRRLCTMIGVAAFLVVCFGVHLHDLDVGATFKGLLEAGPRVTMSFLLGVALLRAHKRGFLANGARRWWCGVALLICLFLVKKGSPVQLPYEFLCIFIIFPLIILAAAGSRPVVPMIARMSGSISYPIYVLQIPIITALSFAVCRFDILPGFVCGVVVIFCFLPLLSYLALRFYDEPVRTALRRRFGSVRHQVS